MAANSDETLEVVVFDAKGGAEFDRDIHECMTLVDVTGDPKKGKNWAEKIQRELKRRAAYKSRVGALTMREAWLRRILGSEAMNPTLVVLDEWPVISDMPGSGADTSEAIVVMTQMLLSMGASLGYHTVVITQSARASAASMRVLGGMQDNFAYRVFGRQTPAMASELGLPALASDPDFELPGVFYILSGNVWQKFRSLVLVETANAKSSKG
jgi:hypothetical protein